MSWSLSVASQQVVSGWGAEAARLRRFLDVTAAWVADQHEAPLRWRTETMTGEQWTDVDAITAEVLRRRLRNEDEERSLVPGGLSRSVVLGYLGDAKDAFVNCRWAVGGDDEWQFTARQDFHTDHDDATGSGAKPLNQYPLTWLCGLVQDSAESVEAVEARVHTMGIFKAVKKVRKEARGRVGVLDLIPHGTQDANLPDSISIHPCASETYPDGVVLSVDLDAAVNDPASVVDDLLIIDDIRMTATPKT